MVSVWVCRRLCCCSWMVCSVFCCHAPPHAAHGRVGCFRRAEMWDCGSAHSPRLRVGFTELQNPFRSKLGLNSKYVFNHRVPYPDVAFIIQRYSALLLLLCILHSVCYTGPIHRHSTPAIICGSLQRVKYVCYYRTLYHRLSTNCHIVFGNIHDSKRC